jgi:hypothetical protein
VSGPKDLSLEHDTILARFLNRVSWRAAHADFFQKRFTSLLQENNELCPEATADFIVQNRDIRRELST